MRDEVERALDMLSDMLCDRLAECDDDKEYHSALALLRAECEKVAGLEAKVAQRDRVVKKLIETNGEVHRRLEQARAGGSDATRRAHEAVDACTRRGCRAECNDNEQEIAEAHAAIDAIPVLPAAEAAALPEGVEECAKELFTTARESVRLIATPPARLETWDTLASFQKIQFRANARRVLADRGAAVEYAVQVFQVNLATRIKAVEEAATKAHDKVTILGLQTSKRDIHARRVSEKIAHEAIAAIVAAARGEKP